MPGYLVKRDSERVCDDLINNTTGILTRGSESQEEGYHTDPAGLEAGVCLPGSALSRPAGMCPLTSRETWMTQLPWTIQ